MYSYFYLTVAVICISRSSFLCQAFHVIEELNTTYTVPGAHFVNLSDPWFYDTFVPLVYEVKLPNWDSSDVKLEWPEGYSNACESTDSWADNWTHMACPVIHSLNGVTSTFLKNLTNWSIFNRPTSPTAQHSNKPMRLYSCGEIRPHFTSYSLGAEEREEYLFEDLKNCPFGQTVFEEIVVPWSHVNTSLYAKMLERFIDETVAPTRYRVTSYTKYAVTTNAYVGFQAIKYLDFVYSSSKWTNAFSTCSNFRIPEGLISQELLSNSLKEIERIVSDKGLYKLTIDKSDFGTYYKLQLADCVFTSFNTYLVRILVPVRKKVFQYKLAVAHPIPFLQTVGEHVEVCEYAEITEKFIIELNTGQLVASDCVHDQLCLIPDMGNRPLLSYCMTAVLKNLTGTLLEDCTIKCRKLDVDHLPFIKRLATDKYVVMGRAISDIFVSCGDVPFKVINPPEVAGALEITLPCSCQLVHRTESLHSMSPCGTELILRKIMPRLPSRTAKWFNRSEIQPIRDSDNAAQYKEPDYDESYADLKLSANQRDCCCNPCTTFITAYCLPSVIILSCVLVMMMLILIGYNVCCWRLHNRVQLLEHAESQRVSCHIYDTFVRANDD